MSVLPNHLFLSPLIYTRCADSRLAFYRNYDSETNLAVTHAVRKGQDYATCWNVAGVKFIEYYAELKRFEQSICQK